MTQDSNSPTRSCLDCECHSPIPASNEDKLKAGAEDFNNRFTGVMKELAEEDGHASTTDWRDELREITSRMFVVPELIAFIEKTIAAAEERGAKWGTIHEGLKKEAEVYQSGRAAALQEVIELVEGMKWTDDGAVEKFDKENQQAFYNHNKTLEDVLDLLASLQDKKDNK